MTARLQHARQNLQQPPESFSAMAMEILKGAGKFSERFLQSREVKDRVVTKAAGPSGRLENKSIHAIADDGNYISFPRHRQYANKARRPRFIPLSRQCSKEFCDVWRVRGRRARVARGMHAWFAAEGGNHQPGIIRAHCLVGNGRRMQCLADGIFSERGRILGKWRKLGKSRQ